MPPRYKPFPELSANICRLVLLSSIEFYWVLLSSIEFLMIMPMMGHHSIPWNLIVEQSRFCRRTASPQNITTATGLADSVDSEWIFRLSDEDAWAVCIDWIGMVHIGLQLSPAISSYRWKSWQLWQSVTYFKLNTCSPPKQGISL